MTRPAVFIQDCGIYGKKERKAYKTRDGSAFSVFKDEKNWTIGQDRSGCLIVALVPKHVQRSKRALLAFVSAMENEQAEACAMLSLADGFPMHKDIRPFGQQLVDWAKDYRDAAA